MYFATTFKCNTNTIRLKRICLTLTTTQNSNRYCSNHSHPVTRCRFAAFNTFFCRASQCVSVQSAASCYCVCLSFTGCRVSKLFNKSSDGFRRPVKPFFSVFWQNKSLKYFFLDWFSSYCVLLLILSLYCVLLFIAITMEMHVRLIYSIKF